MQCKYFLRLEKQPIMFPRTLTTGMLCKRNPTTYFIGKRIGIKIFFLRKLLSTQYSEKILQMGPYSLMSPYKETTVGKFIIVCNCLSQPTVLCYAVPKSREPLLKLEMFKKGKRFPYKTDTRNLSINQRSNDQEINGRDSIYGFSWGKMLL